MRKNSILFKSLISFVTLIFILFLSSCELTSEVKYKLTYQTNGEGTISCIYANNEDILENTNVELKAIANENNNFVKWTLNGSEYSSQDTINIKINKNCNIVAYFEQSGYDKLDNLVNGENAYVKATVVATFSKGYLIKDEGVYALVYTGVKSVYSVGDVVSINAKASITNQAIYLTSITNSSLIEHTTFEDDVTLLSDFDVTSYIASNTYGKRISLDGTITYTNGSYVLTNDTSSYSFVAYYPNLDSLKFDKVIGKDVSATGYLWTNINDDSVNVIFTSLVIEDIGEDDPIVINDGNINAFFDSSWTNVKISINGGSYYSMTESDGYFSYPYTKNVDTVSFKSGTKETLTFDIDSESLCFVIGEKKFNNYYSGYFTTSENRNNEVIKINTVSMNDMHGYISQTNGKGGISNASYIINQIRNEDSYDNTLLVANGDMFQGTAISNLTRGESVVKLMNAMDFDFMGIGNHEFDWGIEEILKYFDGDESNGEADFPLVNSNITYKKDDKLVTNVDGNVVETLMLNKYGLKIGIVSCIGPLSSSILQTRVSDYTFQNVYSTACALCKSLRDSGADIVLVNIHDGESSSILKYNANILLATEVYKGKPLVDVIINGHTHTNQVAHYERNGADLPLMQASSNCYYVGNIDLYYDTVNDKVIYSTVDTYNVNSTAGTNYDKYVQDIYDAEYAKVKTQIEEVYCKAGETISSKAQLYTWAANVMATAVGADVAFSNTGGLRSTGNITIGKDIMLENMFMICPFDNEIILCDVKGSNLKSYIKSTGNYYGFREGLSESAIESSKTYKVATIDYVYYGNYFVTNSNPVNTKVIYREAMIADLKLRTSFKPSTEATPLIGNLYK